ncbi:transcription factor ovo-like protein 3-like 2 [Homarus americanus]|uniref:Transcription factor ovo-like protein 3-like 2 n=1 Tax=Homarus americanus TaxID=6706 RepID=A0A8J5K671_HOMAM|nr:transcription factor ovo-like protein 3-like 2 [Homarus americanus]
MRGLILVATLADVGVVSTGFWFAEARGGRGKRTYSSSGRSRSPSWCGSGNGRWQTPGSQACRVGLGTFTTCHTCGQRFHGVYQKYNLKRHMSIHTGERPYPCPRCPAAFNQKCNMKRHLESVHGEKVPPQSLLSPQDLPQVVASSNQCMVSPSNQCMVSPSNECMVSLSNQCMVSPSNECMVSPSNQCMVSPSNQCMVSPSNECMVSLSNQCAAAPSNQCAGVTSNQCAIASSNQCVGTPSSQPLLSPMPQPAGESPTNQPVVASRDPRPRGHSHLSTSEVAIARALLTIPDQSTTYSPATPFNTSTLPAHSVSKISLQSYSVVNSCSVSTASGVSLSSSSPTPSVSVLRGSSCPECGKIFRGDYHKYNLKKHLTIHAGLRPYSCPICNMAFNQKVSMKRHFASVHKILDPKYKVDPGRPADQ